MAPQCSNCGTEVDSKAMQCPSCNARFNDRNSILRSIPASWIGVGSGIILAVVLFLAEIVSTALIIGIGAGTALTLWTLLEYAHGDQ